MATVERLEVYEEPMTQDDRRLLGNLELMIEEGISSFYTVGASLRQIRDSRLYREQFDSFEEYCNQRWRQLDKPHAHRLIKAADTYDRVAGQDGQDGEQVVPMGTVEVSERAIRPIAALPEKVQKEAWDKAKSLSGGVPTSRITEAVAGEYKERKTVVRHPICEVLSKLTRLCSKHGVLESDLYGEITTTRQAIEALTAMAEAL